MYPTERLTRGAASLWPEPHATWLETAPGELCRPASALCPVPSDRGAHAEVRFGFMLRVAPQRPEGTQMLGAGLQFPSPVLVPACGTGTGDGAGLLRASALTQPARVQLRHPVRVHGPGQEVGEPLVASGACPVPRRAVLVQRHEVVRASVAVAIDVGGVGVVPVLLKLLPEHALRGQLLLRAEEEVEEVR